MKALQRALGILVVVMTVVAIGAAPAMAAGFAIHEKGAKGLGAAFSGAALHGEDSSVIFFNPAAMTLLEKNNATATANIITTSAKFEDKGSTQNPTGQTLTGGNGGDAGGTFVVPNLFYAHSLSPDLKAGIGITIPFGLETAYDDNWKGRYHAIKSQVQAIDINPSVAYRIGAFSIGAGASAQRFDASLSRAIDFGTATGLGVGGFPLNPTRWQNYDGKVQLEADDWSYGYNFGAMYEVSKNARMGAAYRSSIKHKLTGDATFTVPNDTFSQLLANARNWNNTTASTEIELPASASLNGYYRFMNDFALMTDITWTQWSSLDELRIKFDNGAADSVTTLDYRDTWRYSIGLQYFATEKCTGRLGFAYDQTPVRGEQTRTPLLPDEDRYWFSLGGSYMITPSVGVDIGYAYLMIDDARINKDSTTDSTNEEFLRGALDGEYKSNTHIVSVQLMVAF